MIKQLNRRLSHDSLLVSGHEFGLKTKTWWNAAGALRRQILCLREKSPTGRLRWRFFREHLQGVSVSGDAAGDAGAPPPHALSSVVDQQQTPRFLWVSANLTSPKILSRIGRNGSRYISTRSPEPGQLGQVTWFRRVRRVTPERLAASAPDVFLTMTWRRQTAWKS